MRRELYFGVFSVKHITCMYLCVFFMRELFLTGSISFAIDALLFSSRPRSSPRQIARYVGSYSIYPFHVAALLVSRASCSFTLATRSPSSLLLPLSSPLIRCSRRCLSLSLLSLSSCLSLASLSLALSLAQTPTAKSSSSSSSSPSSSCALLRN